MPNILKIVDISTPGGKILREVAEPVEHENILSPKIQSLIADMMLTYKSAGLVGLAAPQVGISERIVVVSSEPRPGYRDAPVVLPFAMINPVITECSEEKAKGFEGCGSTKNVRGYPRAKIWRSKAVSVMFFDHNGQPKQEYFEGFLARVVQHEIDHLEGFMFTDRKVPEDRLYEQDEFEKLAEEEKKPEEMKS